MNEYGIFDGMQNYKDKLERKTNSLKHYQEIIEAGEKFTEVQYKEREVLLAEISLLKLFIEDLDYIIDRYVLTR